MSVAGKHAVVTGGGSGVGAEIAAVPNIRSVQSGEIDVKVRSTLYGVKENILKGEGSEFHQLRDWMPGMDPRTIDWKQSARHRGLVAKEMRAERNHHVVLALDNGFLMRERIDGLPKIDHAVNAALAVAWAAGLGGDLVGLFAFDAQPRLFLPPEPGRAAFPRLRARMAGLAYESVETNHTLAMAHLHQRLRRRALLQAVPGTLFRLRADGAVLEGPSADGKGGAGASETPPHARTVLDGAVADVVLAAGARAMASASPETFELPDGRKGCAAPVGTAEFWAVLVPDRSD